MKIMIIRHGEPDNPNQTLTKKGFEEVKALSEMYKDYPFDEMYSSPLARAKLTAEAVLSPNNKKAIIVDWLKEFYHPVINPKTGEEMFNWDFKPSFFTSQEEFYHPDQYLKSEIMKSGNVEKEYLKVVEEFDKVLAKNGYVREGKYYRVENANRKTIVFFCHFAMMSVLMSHLMGIPYVLIAQMFACAPTGVTVFNSEEREKGIAQFRCSR